jgi:hypothetical protein
MDARLAVEETANQSFDLSVVYRGKVDRYVPRSNIDVYIPPPQRPTIR